MPDLLLELRSEEIPARMQRRAAGDLRKLVTDGLVEAGLTYEGCQEYWTPRRLVLDLRGVAARSRDVREEIRVPSTKAPEQAVQGFLRKAGLSSVAEAQVRADPKKGDFYVAVLSRPGRAAPEIVAELVPAVVRAFPWPKSMRWGPASAKPGALRWVRPLQSILCVFGPETGETEVVDFEVDGIRSGNVTSGHRFHAPEPIVVRRFEDYSAKLEAAKVVLDAERRKQIVLSDARNLAFAAGLELVEDDDLAEEVSGLVEWPVVLMGGFDEAFLDIPAEIVRLTIKANQKCFVTRPAYPSSGPSGHLLPQGEKEGRGGAGGSPSPLVGEGGSARSARTGEGYRLANRFLLTANIEASDGGATIAEGNGKVVRARLSDAVHFWKTDQADLPDLDRLQASADRLGLKRDASGKLLPLDQRMARLDHLGVTFHAKLGTQGERVERIARLAQEIAPAVGADATLARRAALLAKADLQTEVVGEFPELQGAMGRRYALLQGEDAAVAAAIEEHYRPQGPSDRVPSAPVSIAVALADKLDTLVGFWAIDEKPTGSKDPYALRRAALGVVRILVENGVGLANFETLIAAYIEYLIQFQRGNTFVYVAAKNLENTYITLNRNRVPYFLSPKDENYVKFDRDSPIYVRREEKKVQSEFTVSYVADSVIKDSDRVLPSFNAVATDLLSFLHDRLKVYLRDRGARHDLIDAVLAGGASPSPSPSPRKDGERETPARVTPSPRARGEGEGEGHSATGKSGGQSPSAANDDLLLIVRRVEALGALLATEDGKNLLAGAKRAANILAAEEKKGTEIAAAVDPALFSEPQEAALLKAVTAAESQAGAAIAALDYGAAMRALAALRAPVDAFFETVLVNADDPDVRANRLALLARIRAATGQVADFSKIAG